MLTGCFLLTAALAGCSSGLPEKHNVDNTVIEAGYRFLFDNNASGLQKNVSAFCVGQGTAGAIDPAPAVLAALGDVRPTVMPASACAADAQAIVKATKQSAIIFEIRDLQCNTSDRCSFWGGYYEGNLSSSSRHYLAERVNGHWIIRLNPNTPQVIS